MSYVSTLISRDPFARTELHRTTVASPIPCKWCGNWRMRGGKYLRRLFRYSTQTDGGRSHDHGGLFCSKSCHDAYHT